jgi:hypothetical protein
MKEMMQERGVAVDHGTINRWVLTYSPQLAEAVYRRKRLVLMSWRIDEIYIRIRGQVYAKKLACGAGTAEIDVFRLPLSDVSDDLLCCGSSAAVTTAFTPGRVSARLAPMVLMRAWACGLRRTLIIDQQHRRLH